MENNELKSIRICFNGGEHDCTLTSVDLEIFTHVLAAVQSELETVMKRKIRIDLEPRCGSFLDVTLKLREEEEPAEQQNI